MQFSRQSALAAIFYAVTVSARCPPKYPQSSSASAVAPYATTALNTTVPTNLAVAVTPKPSTTLATVVSYSASASATATAASTGGSSGLTTDEQAALDAHNDARSEVGLDALTWDSTLVSAAQEWADTLGARGPGQLEHGSTGENLYWQSNSDDPFTAAANAWIAEKADYNGEAIPSSGDASWMHYSQIIWATTTNLGMAIADDGAGGVYVVARYDPAGNYVGEVPTEATN